MKKYYPIKYVLIYISSVLLVGACGKYLDEKPSKQMYVPSTWQDLQAILDQSSAMNLSSLFAIIELISDNLYVKEDRWSSASPDLRGAYIWEDGTTQYKSSWSGPYSCIFKTNVILETLDKIRSDIPTEKADNIEGSALFYRSFAYFYLLQLYAKPYSPSNSEELGIVLKLSGDITENVKRVTLKESYSKVISDLEKALVLLPEKAENVMRPSKVAVRALLSRIYLTVRNYGDALKFAEGVIEKYPLLLDYNELPTSDMIDFQSNPEVIFMSVLANTALTTTSTAIIDTSLYSSYEPMDLRRTVYFANSSAGGPGKYRFKGSYFNISNVSCFHGLATDEIYLNLAECYTRNGEVNRGLDTLNSLLKRRHKVGFFEGYSNLSQEEALDVILNERRKELLFRGLRWSDIRRLNQEGRNIELKRQIGLETFTLPPNDLRSVLLIPDVEVTRSGIPQNTR